MDAPNDRGDGVRIFAYVAGGSGNGLTQTKNVEAFQTYGIVPRMLRDRTTRDLSVTLFGRPSRFSSVALSTCRTVEHHRLAALA